jgi:hypothetical protein
MMSCNSQASLHNPERVDPSRSSNLAMGTSQSHVDDEHINPLPIVGPMHTSDAVVVTRDPPTDPSPPQEVQARIPSPRVAPSPTGIVQRENSTISDIIQEVIQVANPTHTPLEPLTVVPSSPIMLCYCEGEEVVEEQPVQGERTQNEEASTPAVEVAQTMPPAQASTSAVNVVPMDASNPEATINAPQAVRRYLTRWPQGEKDPHPVFNNTDMHDWRTMHNNQDDMKRRAELAKVVPRHVNVSFVQPFILQTRTKLLIHIFLCRHFHIPFHLSSRSFGFRLHNDR